MPEGNDTLVVTDINQQTGTVTVTNDGLNITTTWDVDPIIWDTNTIWETRRTASLSQEEMRAQFRWKLVPGQMVKVLLDIPLTIMGSNLPSLALEKNKMYKFNQYERSPWDMAIYVSVLDNQGNPWWLTADNIEPITRRKLPEWF